jgi:carbamoyl-phosphate synthase large subunit
MKYAVEASPERPVLVDKFLEDATEVDVDCITDVGHFKNQNEGTIVIGGMLEHIEFAGVHSGDAAMVLPPHTLSQTVIATIREYTHAMARELKVIGLMNVQYAVKGEKVYVLEVNPRASRTVPFVSKAIGRPLAKIAAKVMAGKTLKELGFTQEIWPEYWAVKESVFPFNRFHGQDILLSPEMRSTGEVMGIDRSFEVAFAKSQLGGGTRVPRKGTVFVSVREIDKTRIVDAVRLLFSLGFKVMATSGTQRFLADQGVPTEKVNKVLEGRPHIVDAIMNGDIQLVFNTTEGPQALADSRSLRRAALLHKVPYYTTLSGAVAAAQGIRAYLGGDLEVRTLQSYFSES